jgi:hypothetical protein
MHIRSFLASSFVLFGVENCIRCSLLLKPRLSIPSLSVSCIFAFGPGSNDLVSDISRVAFSSCCRYITLIFDLGNGPSALILSFLLHGNIPYYDSTTYGPHPDDILHSKLSRLASKSLYDALRDPQSVAELTCHFQSVCDRMSYSSDALPINVLLDALNRPDGDMQIGEACPRIRWQHEPEKAVPHIVFGSAKSTGGQWNENIPCSSWNLGSLSYAEMLSLPMYTFERYAQDHQIANIDIERPTRRQVADYYATYPKAVGISEAFRSATWVNSVSRCEGRNSSFCVQYCKVQQPGNPCTPRMSSIRCRNLVLACGVFQSMIEPPTSLSVLSCLPESPCKSDGNDALLVIGSGVSAADVILSAPPHQKIIHMFKWHPETKRSPLRPFHPSAYPEYAMIYRHMKSAAMSNSLALKRSTSPLLRRKSIKWDRDWHSTYEGLANAQILTTDPAGNVVIHREDGEVIHRKVSQLEYLVGRHGSVKFLSGSLQQEIIGQNIDGTISMKHLSSSENNPVDQHGSRLSRSSLRDRVSQDPQVAPNVFVIGSLSGDSLVQFAHGLAVYTAGSLTRASSKEAQR